MINSNGLRVAFLAWLLISSGARRWSLVLRQVTLPVQRDATEVEDGGCGQQDIQRGPHQAEGLAKDPVLLEQLDSPERHHQDRHQQVRKGQRHNEVIGLYFPVMKMGRNGT